MPIFLLKNIFETFFITIYLKTLYTNVQYILIKCIGKYISKTKIAQKIAGTLCV